MRKYRTDCMNLMKYCNMQKQLIADFNLRKRELEDDQDFLDTELVQAKVDHFKLKIGLSETHNMCEAQSMQNQTAQENLDLMLQNSTMQGPVIDSVQDSANNMDEKLKNSYFL